MPNIYGDVPANDGRIQIGQSMRWMSDLHEILPTFDPTKADVDIESWIEKMEEYAALYAWNEVAKKHYALIKLSGVTKKWRDSLAPAQRTWEEWKVLLKEAFPSEVSDVKKRLRAQTYTRRQGQDVTEYYYEKLARCNKAGMSDKEAVE